MIKQGHLKGVQNQCPYPQTLTENHRCIIDEITLNQPFSLQNNFNGQTENKLYFTDEDMFTVNQVLLRTSTGQHLTVNYNL